MASIQRMDAALGMFVDRKMRDIHTGLRARVVDVDYDIPSATVQPLASTAFADGTTDAYPAIFDVPLQMVSGNGGKSRLTIPVKPGDIVGLAFSERNESDGKDKTTHGLFPGWAITSVHSDGNAQPIHPDNVELWNDQVHFSMTPDGDFTLTGPVGKITMDKTGKFEFTNGAATITGEPSGDVKISNGAANFAAKADGNIEMNGAKITPDGNLITARGTNMNDFFDYFMRHTHHYTWTDGAGEKNTDGPNA